MVALFAGTACGSGQSVGPDERPTSASTTTAGAGPTPSSTNDQEEPVDEPIPVTITIGDRVLQGHLRDNPTAQDLAGQLPMTLEFEDYGQVEKIAALPRPLTMDGVPAGDDPEPYDVGYYEPHGVLVLYYGDVGYWNGIVRLGRFVDPDDVVRSQRGTFVAEVRRSA